MSKSIKKLKRIHSKTGEKQLSNRQCRNENEKRRRDLFSKLISNLEELLSLTEDSSSKEPTNKYDKASILRQTVQYLQKNQQTVLNNAALRQSDASSKKSKQNRILDCSWNPPIGIMSSIEWLQIAIESMHCLFLVIKPNSYSDEIAYVSKNIISFLGYSQNELLNRPLLDFIHPLDHDRVRDYLLNDHRVLASCNVSWKRAVDDDYEQCTIFGAFRTVNNNEKCLISIVKLNTIDRTLVVSNEDSSEEFTTHLNVYGKFIFIDAKARECLGYSSFEIIGRTYFDFVHPDDLSIIVRAHQLWKQNGCGDSDIYRFLTKGQQWIFLQTACQVQINSWNGKAESYICKTHVTSSNSKESVKLRLSSTNIKPTDLNLEGSMPMQATAAADIQLETLEERETPAESEITSFLAHLGNESYRKSIREKLIGRRQAKEAEIRVRQEEIQVIEDMLQFINQYQSKNSSALPTSQVTYQPGHSLVTQDFSGRFLDHHNDAAFLNNSLSNTNADFTFSSNSKDDTSIDPLTLFFSPSPTAFNISSPIVAISNTDSTDDLRYASTRKSSSRSRSSNTRIPYT